MHDATVGAYGAAPRTASKSHEEGDIIQQHITIPRTLSASDGPHVSSPSILQAMVRHKQSWNSARLRAEFAADEPESEDALIERLGRERPSKFNSFGAEVAFCYSTIASEFMAVGYPSVHAILVSMLM